MNKSNVSGASAIGIFLGVLAIPVLVIVALCVGYASFFATGQSTKSIDPGVEAQAYAQSGITKDQAEVAKSMAQAQATIAESRTGQYYAETDRMKAEDNRLKASVEMIAGVVTIFAFLFGVGFCILWILGKLNQ